MQGDAISSTVTGGYTIQAPPPPAGSLEIVAGFLIQVRRRPLWLHRTMMRLVFGWKWKDAPQ